MKCLVFSDSHNYPYFMEKAIRKNPDTEIVFFLGDGLSDIEELYYRFPRIKFLSVKGNCDFRFIVAGEAVQKTAEIHIFDKKIVYTHGDLYGAKYGKSGLSDLARSRAADIVLFGHTHKAELEYVNEGGKPHYLFNPGSAGARAGEFGILTLTEGQEPLFSHGCFA